MPYHIVRDHSECPSSRPWAVVKDDDGEVIGCHETQDDAAAQIGAIEAEEEASLTAAAVPSARQINARVKAGREKAMAHEEELAAAYERALTSLARLLARRFRERATVLLAAANWEPPNVDDVLAVANRANAMRKAQRAMVEALAAEIATLPALVSFDVLHPVVQRLLDELGKRAEALGTGLREPVAKAIADAWAEGLSVPQTAAKIQGSIEAQIGYRATALARTDLISLSNGAGNWAVGELNQAARAAGEEPPVKSKTWTSAGDSRVRPSHQDADGQTVPIDQPFSVGGVELAYPGDPSGPDEEVMQCRCVEVYGDDVAFVAASDSWKGALGFSKASEEAIVSAVEVETATRWVSDVAFEGTATDDGRWMEPGSLGWRELPLTLMAQVETQAGHDGAQVAGRMDTLTKDDELDMNGGALPEGWTAIRSTGVFDDGGEFGADIARMVENETLRGVSIDLAVMHWAFRDPETAAIIDPEEATVEEWDRAFMGELQFAVLEGNIMAATVVPTPAFSEARIAVVASARTRWPGLWKDENGRLMMTLYASLRCIDEESDREHGLLASVAPIAPPQAWFTRQEGNGPTPLTITPEGEIYGHIALWDTCHTGFLNGSYSQCIRAPRTATGYAHFHVGELMTEEGHLIPIGKLTLDTGHASLNAGRVAARAHYDETGAVGAFVRAKDGQFGIWVCGAVRSDLRPELLRDLRANPPSGDWRSVDGSLELIAALSVPVPGFPVPRSQLALAASADGELEVTALILTGLVAAVEDSEEREETPLDGAEATVLAAMIEGGAEALHELIEA